LRRVFWKEVFVRAARTAASARKLENWNADPLADLRNTLEEVIETRFGPLDDRDRRRIQKWSQDRLAEAAEDFPDARELEDLGL